jgi:hypothetical protein
VSELTNEQAIKVLQGMQRCHSFMTASRLQALCMAEAALRGMGEPVAWIEHHKGGDNLVWDDPGGGKTPLYAPHKGED